MDRKRFKISILTVLLSLAACFTSFAAGRTQFPFDIDFDTDVVDRLCYAGHNGDTVKYSDGFAVLPDTFFSISANGSSTDADVQNLSADISLVYENDDRSGSYKETVRTYDKGDLDTDDSFQLLSENTAASLSERDKLYSGSLQGMVMTLNYEGKNKRKKTIYLYICDEDDYFDFHDAASN